MSTPDEKLSKAALWSNVLNTMLARVPTLTDAEQVADAALEAYEARFDRPEKREAELKRRGDGIVQLQRRRETRVAEGKAREEALEASAAASLEAQRRALRGEKPDA